MGMHGADRSTAGSRREFHERLVPREAWFRERLGSAIGLAETAAVALLM
jgi:hypothetical protein